MPVEHHVVISWSGSTTRSQPLVEILQRLNYSYSTQQDGANTQLQIVVESESMRGLRDAVDELLVHLSSLED
jgi:hypothetical protein